MRYHIADIELSEPLPTLSLRGDEAGVALVVRHRGRPVDFVLSPLARRSALTPDEITSLIGPAAASAVIAAGIRNELTARAPAVAPSVTVAVCTHDRPKDLTRCLAALARAVEGRGDHVEVLVVDNAPSSDETRHVAHRHGARYACEPVAGLDVARNRALREANGELVAFLDDDVVVDPGWPAGLDAAIAAVPAAAIVTGAVLPLELETVAQVLFERRGGFRRGFQARLYAGPTLPGNRLYPVGSGIFGAGCNMVVRRDVALGLGGFDEALDTGPPLPGGGDLDMFYRVLRAGHALVYEPSMLVFHGHRRAYAALRSQYASWGAGFTAFLAKTYRREPSARPAVRALLRWWAGYEARLLRRGLQQEAATPAELVLAEIGGGMAGLLGGYERSRRRMAARRREAAE